MVNIESEISYYSFSLAIWGASRILVWFSTKHAAFIIKDKGFNTAGLLLNDKNDTHSASLIDSHVLDQCNCSLRGLFIPWGHVCLLG